MNELKWFFPGSGSEALDLFKNDYRPHAGGTYLIKTPLNIRGLFDLSRIRKYREIKAEKSAVSIGAAVSYTETARFCEKMLPQNILSSALSKAAATPLRNRITIGGSAAALPIWSDLASPLAAAGADIFFEGSEDIISAVDYFNNRDIRKNNLVSSVRIPTGYLNGAYYRCTLTGFDYPFFTIAVSIRGKNMYNCAFSGCRGFLKIFSGSRDVIITEAEKKLEFSDRREFSGDYLKHRAATALKRLLSTGGSIDE
ncbi:MAG: FAD binding domain-containing protein [Spirochaetales bacterium]|uniref:FAD binding domain-containing protein n=1 Tax=Candidatus Thalassospirochaeta sargassi TaxID=3119039 RepID=A0AAJ1IH91_9SPIO|nr:FAD binding domain-containing protein [Spirochaetales bacterium]